MWLDGQTEDFYFSGINSVPEKCRKHIELSRDYTEKIVLFVTFPFFFMVELQNFLYAARRFVPNHALCGSSKLLQAYIDGVQAMSLQWEKANFDPHISDIY